MSGTALALVLAASVLHAGWNALAKRGLDQLRFLWSAAAVASVLFAPIALPPLLRDGVPRAAWPYIAATIALHALYFYALGRSYRVGELSLVYPVARGLGVALVPVLALPALGEQLSPLGIVGVALVVAGIVTMHLAVAGGRVTERRAPLSSPGTAWAVLTGLTIAGYALVDKAGVARLHPVPYVALLFVGSVALLAPLVLGDRGALRREWAGHGVRIALAGVMTVTAYLMVLLAFRLAKVGYVVAAREISIVLSILIGRRWLGERSPARRLAGAALVLMGVGCLAFAR